MPFKNLFNEWFAKDTSRKVKASLKAKFHNGERISAYAPIGYLKDPEVKNHLVVDPETRWIVEKIFDYAVHGAGAARITKILIQEKVPTPGWLNFRERPRRPYHLRHLPADRHRAGGARDSRPALHRRGGGCLVLRRGGVLL